MATADSAPCRGDSGGGWGWTKQDWQVSLRSTCARKGLGVSEKILGKSEQQTGWQRNVDTLPLSVTIQLRRDEAKRDGKGEKMFVLLFCYVGIYQPPWGGVLFEPPVVHILQRARDVGPWQAEQVPGRDRVTSSLLTKKRRKKKRRLW